MLLQELFEEKNKELTSVYSVEINKESTKVEYSSPPENLEEIGFLFVIDEDGMMSEDLMDIVISYRLANLPVVIEVPSKLLSSEKLDIKYLVQLANNVDFAVSLLPPNKNLDPEDCSMDEYAQIIEKMVDELLQKPNFDKFIYPISNFFEYLMLENILSPEALKDFRPEQKYITDNFVQAMSKEDSDKFKNIIRNKLYDFYGGKENFDLIAKTMIDKIVSKAKGMFKDIVVNYIQEQKQQQQQN